MVLKLWSQTSNVSSARNLLEMHISRPCLAPAESATPGGWGPVSPSQALYKGLSGALCDFRKDVGRCKEAGKPAARQEPGLELQLRSSLCSCDFSSYPFPHLEIEHDCTSLSASQDWCKNQ